MTVYYTYLILCHLINTTGMTLVIAELLMSTVDAHHDIRVSLYCLVLKENRW